MKLNDKQILALSLAVAGAYLYWRRSNAYAQPAGSTSTGKERYFCKPNQEGVIVGPAFPQAEADKLIAMGWREVPNTTALDLCRGFGL